MKKHKEKIKIGIVIGVFSVIIIACLISIFSQMYTEYKENESFENLSKIVTEEAIDPTITLKKPNLLKVSDSDNEVQAVCITQLTISCTLFPICCR